ncbi:unnamed protein product [Arabis nemorensis]|uniref:RRM domain-containing protein n=1 Tax=Arabis nemorensis TaxID=586526 RepID=A0A565B1E7_9BRAS|nr:unnamed protein product [Arabis nemorensis]
MFRPKSTWPLPLENLASSSSQLVCRVNKRMTLLEVKGNDPADIPIIRETGRITVTGYDTGLAHDGVVRTLRKHFSSCGEIIDVYIRQLSSNKLGRCAFIYFVGKSAVDKALQLNGSDLGGWKPQVEPLPVPEFASRLPVIRVRGFDTSLDIEDIKNSLSEHFSSCGRVRKVMVLESTDAALVYLEGENAAQKALELGVSSIQGRKVVAKIITTPANPTVHRRRIYGARHLVGRDAAMTAE